MKKVLASFTLPNFSALGLTDGLAITATLLSFLVGSMITFLALEATQELLPEIETIIAGL